LINPDPSCRPHGRVPEGSSPLFFPLFDLCVEVLAMERLSPPARPEGLAHKLATPFSFTAMAPKLQHQILSADKELESPKLGFASPPLDARVLAGRSPLPLLLGMLVLGGLPTFVKNSNSGPWDVPSFRLWYSARRTPRRALVATLLFLFFLTF